VLATVVESLHGSGAVLIPPLGKEVVREAHNYGGGTSVNYGSSGSACCASPPKFLLLPDFLGELVVFRCQPSKKAREQAQANDPAALSECMKESKIFG
jgi:hypothetical protein